MADKSQNEFESSNHSLPPKRSIRNIPINKVQGETFQPRKRAAPRAKPVKESADDFMLVDLPEETPEPVRHIDPEAEESSFTHHEKTGVNNAYPRFNALENEDVDFEEPIPAPKRTVRRKMDSDIVREPAFESAESYPEIKEETYNAPAPRPISRPVRRRVEEDEDDSNSSFEPLHVNRKGKSKVVLATLAIILIAGITLAHTVFAQATVNIKTSPISVPLESQALAEKIPYQSFTKNAEKTFSAAAVKTVQVSKKATGEIIIYNNWSSKPYELVKTTRFETENGSIYRLTADVTVPGVKTSGGKATPGSVSAKVEADKPGSEYNAKGGIELRLPGLIKGTDRYEQIYAKTSANFTGGQVGTAPDTSSKEIQDEIASQRAQAEQEAIAQFTSENPGITLIKDSIKTTSTTGQVNPDGNSARIIINVTTKAIGLNKDALLESISKVVADKNITPTKEGLELLDYKITETSNTSLLNGEFAIEVSGSVSGNTTTNTETLKNDLVGKPVQEAYSAIEKDIPGSEVEISIRPFWKGSLPGNPDKINVNIK